MKRREFFKNMISSSGLLIASPVILSALSASQAFAERRASGPVSDLVDVKDSTAKAVGYIENFTKSKVAKGNKCSTCSLYVKSADRNSKEAGTCAIFPKKFVYGDAYCNSWAKKA
jgi:High potential iron-sulfur protein